MKRIFVAMLLLPVSVAAQTYTVPTTCVPGLITAGWTATEPEIRWNAVGTCVRWECLPAGYTPGTPFRVVTYCGTWAEFAKVPARVATIKKAADPLRSAQNAGKRFKIVPLTDPSMAGMPK